jgi:hypothetical protein
MAERVRTEDNEDEEDEEDREARGTNDNTYTQV